MILGFGFDFFFSLIFFRNDHGKLANRSLEVLLNCFLSQGEMMLSKATSFGIGAKYFLPSGPPLLPIMPLMVQKSG